MARNTRQQRRKARREKQGDEATITQRARTRQQQVRPAAQPPKTQTGRRGGAERGRFIVESWGELKKVEWPGRAQVMQGTVVVLIACAIVGAYLWGADLVLKPLVRQVLTGQ